MFPMSRPFIVYLSISRRARPYDTSRRSYQLPLDETTANRNNEQYITLCGYVQIPSCVLTQLDFL